MRNFLLHIFVSADGYIEDSKGQLDWMSSGKDLDDHLTGILRSIDGMVFGRKAFGLLSQFWPTADKQPDIPREQFELMRDKHKYMLTRSPAKPDWSNSSALVGDAADTLGELKRQKGRDIAIFAGAGAARAALKAGVIDRITLVTCPVMLGAGKKLFEDGLPAADLKLADTRRFESGAVATTWSLVK